MTGVGTGTGTEVRPDRRTVPAADGLPLVLHRWTGPSVRASLFYLHGIQSHAGWLHRTGPELVRRGVEVFVLDRRGSGRSPGVRGHADSAAQLLDDHLRALAVVRGLAVGDRVAALGQSFGASLLAALLVTHRPQLAPVVFCAPALGQQRARSAGAPDRLQELRSGRGEERSPLALADADYTDQEADLAYLAGDALIVRDVTAGMRAAMVALEDAYLAADAIPVPGPTLLATPERDPIIDLGAARAVLRERTPGVVEHRFRTDRHYLEFSADRVRYWDWLAAALTTAGDGGSRCG